MELRLTDNEHALLLQLLQEQQKHLLHEIAKADHHEFKTALRQHLTVLEGLIERLKAPVHSAA